MWETYMLISAQCGCKETPHTHKVFNTRAEQNRQVDIPLFRKTHTQRSIFYYGPILYNSLPMQIRNYELKKYKVEI